MRFELIRTLLVTAAVLSLSVANAIRAEPAHSHPAPEKLGTVHFGASSCAPAVQGQLDRAMALLHSFAYDSAAKAFTDSAAHDPACAIAHWGVAMSSFHQLWSPPAAPELQLGRDQLQEAHRIGARTARERELIDAAAVYFSDTDPSHHAQRALEYEKAMQSVTQHFPHDDEVQIFYALALIATARPSDRSHANQKRAAAILEPIYRRKPDHPGLAHYLIHAYDSEELAQQGLAAARAYAQIAPAAPHALHMPSHIFTRLGFWGDSIESNEAARRVAHEQGDVGEELHAMDYLTYAYLQLGRDAAARKIEGYLRGMGPLPIMDLKVAYAATAIPVRLAFERGRWNDMSAAEPLPDSAPQVAAIAYWARALAHARSGQPEAASADVAKIDDCEAQARARGDVIWADQTGVLSREARAWIAHATGRSEQAVALLRAAADAEDGVEKPSVTPGPVLPAREQLGQLLLELHQPQQALRDLTQTLKNFPGRRGALAAAVRAADAAGNPEAAAAFRRQLASQAPSR
jgi:tetratricopeptide (TPR) repeat protein